MSYEKFTTPKFEQLDQTIDLWISDINEWDNLFLRQHEDLDDTEKKISSNDTQLYTICDQINALKICQKLVEDDIKYIKKIQTILDEKISILEQIDRCSCADLFRFKLYSTAEKIYVQLNNCDELISKYCEKKDNMSCQYFEPFARAMETNLSKLEDLEKNICHLEKKINETEMLKYYTLHKLKLKENKLV